MITIFFIVFFLILAILYVVKNRARAMQTNRFFSTLGIGIGIFVIGAIIALIQPFTLERVDAGHVGIKVNLTGDNRGVSKFEYKTGWVIYNTWLAKLYEFPLFSSILIIPNSQ